MEGWLKLYRKILDWEWADDPNMVALYVRLLCMASSTDCIWHGIAVSRGQIVTSLAQLTVKSGISIQSLRTCLKRLEKGGEITSKTTNKYRLITICNFDAYQSRGKSANKQTNKQVTSNQQATNNQLTTSKEYKNIRIYNKEKEINKEKENSLTLVYDDRRLIDEMFSQGIMIEAFCKDNGISPEQCRKYAESILNEWQLAGTTHRNLTDARQHMIYTIRNRVAEDKQKQSKGGRSRQEWQNELQGEAIRLINKINGYETDRQ